MLTIYGLNHSVHMLRYWKIAIKTNSINTAFSLRNLYESKVIGGITHRFVRVVITWDFVLKNGVVKSDKFSTVNNVGKENFKITKEQSNLY